MGGGGGGELDGRDGFNFSRSVKCEICQPTTRMSARRDSGEFEKID